MVKKTGLWSAYVFALTIAMFALGMLIGNNNLSYLVCMILSWSYIMLTSCFAAEVQEERKVFAYASMAFACLYGVLITIVYFTQLTTVANATAAPDLLDALKYEQLGSWMFNLDILGYGIMGLSTFFLGQTMTVQNRGDQWLKRLLLIHGIFIIPGILLPMMNIFNPEMEGNGSFIGVVVLLGWCLYMVPVTILIIRHFLVKEKENA